MKIAFQGERGAYSELAVRRMLDGSAAETVPCESFDAVFELVASGAADRGVVPVENSLAGTIHRNYDLLLRHPVRLVGEHVLPISHCLIAHPGVPIEQLRVVYSHPQALAQCEGTLRQLGLRGEARYDTAGSVKLIVERGERDAAALASELAAEVHAMHVLRRQMQDHPHNYTRFVMLTAGRLDDGSVEPPDAAGPHKVSVALSLENAPGSLFKALAVFALRDLDLTKLESRPIPGSEWEYMFYLDFVTDDFTGRGRRALQHLREISPMLELLGVYPRSDRF